MPPQLLSSPGQEAEVVSLLQLIGSGATFDGRRVRVIGYATIEFEGTALFLHKEDSDRMILKNSVWLALPYTSPFREFTDHYVYVEGTFKSGARGHLGQCSGALVDISAFGRMPSRKEFTDMAKPDHP